MSTIAALINGLAAVLVIWGVMTALVLLMLFAAGGCD